MQAQNPAGTEGFDFLEYATTDINRLKKQFSDMGFKPVAQHKQHDITLYQQNNIRFLLNNTQTSQANRFAKTHGSGVCAMGFKVTDAQAAYDYAIEKGAKPYQVSDELKPYQMLAIHGVGNSLIYFVDYQQNQATYLDEFAFQDMNQDDLRGQGLTYIDHVTHNLHRGNMVEWLDFYQGIFNFHEIRQFNIKGKQTGLFSKALASPCGNIRIPLNESSDDKSQIEEFLNLFNGEGIQHIALGTDDIYRSVSDLQHNGLEFLDTPDTYYELIEKRLPNHGEKSDLLKKLRILIDGTTRDEKKLLLQIFTQNMLGPVFFEIIQRKGDEGFGEGNFQALFESIELDQIRRGVLEAEEKTT